MNKARIYSNKQGLSWFEAIFIRLLYGSKYGLKYGLLRSSKIKHDFHSINWTFTGFTYGPTDFCSSLIPYDLYMIFTQLSSLMEWTSCVGPLTKHGPVTDSRTNRTIGKE